MIYVLTLIESPTEDDGEVIAAFTTPAAATKFAADWDCGPHGFRDDQSEYRVREWIGNGPNRLTGLAGPMGHFRWHVIGVEVQS